MNERVRASRECHAHVSSLAVWHEHEIILSRLEIKSLGAYLYKRDHAVRIWERRRYFVQKRYFVKRR